MSRHDPRMASPRHPPSCPVDRRAASPAVAALVVVFGLVGASLARAETKLWMSGEDVRTTLTGKQLAGTYPGGRPWRERINADGTSDYEEGEIRRPGRWWLDGPRFCFRYPHPMSGGCFLVVRVGANCYELFSASAPPAPTDRGPPAGASWNGRMWRTETATTCDERPTV